MNAGGFKWGFNGSLDAQSAAGNDEYKGVHVVEGITLAQKQPRGSF